MAQRVEPAATHEAAARTVACPGCGEPAVFAPSNPHRPFCSARCQGHDFGAWASEHYRVSPDASDDGAPQERLPQCGADSADA